MSGIQHLPEHVIAQIKSSTTITSLNSVVCGLVQNSLDASATKITISIDYIRGNCSVEDNGLGIAPDEFTPTGGLGKLHYTSKFPPSGDIHGRHGAFISSVAALSLLSITSHHYGYHSHNSIKIHNTEILARHTPSLPEQRLLSFPHGTRTTVRDLFGSMPVRVKQRAIDAERGANAKNWESLKRALVALLLAWPGQVSISIRDSVDGRSLTIRTPEESSTPGDGNYDTLNLITRVSRIIFQAQLSDDRSRDLWVPLKASAGAISVVGAISLVPVSSRQIQFISIGVRPISNDHGPNVIYEEINRLFANSSFGVEEESENFSENNQNKQVDDRRMKLDRYTNQDLKGRKGVDRWPMFYIKITLGQVSRIAHYDVEEIIDEHHKSLKAIMDVLSAVVYEFLKAHHFRPRHPRSRRITSKRSSSCDLRRHSLSRSSTPKDESRVAGSKLSRTHIPSAGDLASTRLNIKSSHSSLRHPTPFDSWSRIKSGQPQYAHLYEKSSDCNITGYTRSQNQPTADISHLEDNDNISDTPLVASDGTLLRIPFPDVEMDTPWTIHRSTSEEEGLSRAQLQLREGKELLWTNPTTKDTLVIDTRTGSVIRPFQPGAGGSELPDEIRRLPLRKKLRINTKPIASDIRSEWLCSLISSWTNPVFEIHEPPIPVAFDEGKVLFLATNTAENGCHGCDSGLLESFQTSYSMEGRLSKESLRNASVISQVDRKFILAKVPLPSPPTVPSTGDKSQPSLLVIIDQHAADERCRIEALMKDYFMVVEDSQGPVTGKPRLRIHAQAELLEKPIVFDISVRDSRRFEQSAEYFKHWGVVFQVILVQKSKRDSVEKSKLKVFGLPPSIAERCRSEPRLLIELLRKEISNLDEHGHSTSQQTRIEATQGAADGSAELHWLARFHGCPSGIMEMINSRACRSSIMFNDVLSHEECVSLVSRLADCTLPFQCAHGRPSMVPLVDLSRIPTEVIDVKKPTGRFGQQFKKWKSSMGNS
ncbi:uncharacterized protein F4812DRAFT_415204 [Daldinia caldariorum]|uniref:uncharacterized protein n=1 Tax=Daldinia caldariorum TaxID=326644 RepID=UPI002007D992|nr:uncharacterized protein F4812DRAFT_415204 [Daldinia caldariorum]KAI1471714.1 hypothetical protein F4812DRAFT_415204 [Daldinia caldariorum]